MWAEFVASAKGVEEDGAAGSLGTCSDGWTSATAAEVLQGICACVCACVRVCVCVCFLSHSVLCVSLQLSSMSDTIVHVHPDHCFYITVQSRLLPDTHSLYTTHTLRITHLSQVTHTHTQPV